MGRARASLSKTALDRVVATEVDTAQRAVDRAIAVCRKAGKGESPPPRLARVLRDLARARGALGSISRSSPGWDTSDPDFMSDEDWAAKRREDREEKEKERREAERLEAERLEAERIALEAELEAEAQGAD